MSPSIRLFLKLTDNNQIFYNYFDNIHYHPIKVLPWTDEYIIVVLYDPSIFLVILWCNWVTTEHGWVTMEFGGLPFSWSNSCMTRGRLRSPFPRQMLRSQTHPRSHISSRVGGIATLEKNKYGELTWRNDNLMNWHRLVFSLSLSFNCLCNFHLIILIP